MPCEWLKMADGTVVHINRGRSGGKKQICKFCNKRPVTKECDYPVEHGKTCDAGMCDDCARTLGYQDIDIGHGIKRLNDTWDVCPIHRGLSRPKPTQQETENSK